MPTMKKIGSTTLIGSSPVIKVDSTSQEFSIHLGPFMPFNSAGFAISAVSSSQIIKTNSTIVIEQPKKT